MFTMTIRTRDLHTTAHEHKHQHGAHLVDEDDLEGLGLLRLPDRDLALREERVAQLAGPASTPGEVLEDAR